MSSWDGVDFGDLTCREFVELVTEYLEDRLDADVLLEAVCPGCARYLEQIRESTQALGRVSLDSISSTARDQLLEAFRTWRTGRAADPG